MNQYNTSKRKGKHSQSDIVQDTKDWLYEKLVPDAVKQEKKNQKKTKKNIKDETGY